MNKLRALKNKKGFTLVEIIVVLVILAILAAFGIPSMIGFINDARGKAFMAEARTAYTALQIVFTEDAMKNPPLINSASTADPPVPTVFDAGIADAAAGTTSDAVYVKRITDLLAPDITYADTGSTAVMTIPEFRAVNGQVVGLIYRNGNVYIAFASGQPAEDFTTFADARLALNRMVPIT